MKAEHEVGALMSTIPKRWRTKWCGGERGPCACLGCVQVGNRMVMVELVTGQPFRGDAEWVDERRIPDEIYKECKISRAEWDAWMGRQG